MSINRQDFFSSQDSEFRKQSDGLETIGQVLDKVENLLSSYPVYNEHYVEAYNLMNKIDIRLNNLKLTSAELKGVLSEHKVKFNVLNAKLAGLDLDTLQNAPKAQLCRIL